MNTTKPSAGALRAAEAYIKGRGDTPPQNTEAATLMLARIIDGKSGLAEALDALRGMVGLVQIIHAREPDLDNDLMNNHRFIEAQRVIAKAENPNATVQQVAPAGRWTEKGTV